MSALAEALIAAQAELPTALKRGGPMRDRLLSKIELSDDGCWLWTAHRDVVGYGRLRVGPTSKPAHNLVYEVFVGAVPEGLELDHLCRNRGCVNPEHLEPVTHRENVLRGASPIAAAAAQTHCLRGHALSGDNVYIIPSSGSRQCRTCKRMLR